MEKQSCHSCMQHSALTCSVNAQSIIEIFLMVPELCSRNELKQESQDGPRLLIAFKANYLCGSIFSSSGHFDHQGRTVLAILVKGNLSNILIKFE